MTTNNKIDKKELKVYVTMHNNARLMGSFYLEHDQRLQDLMNDERMFLPLYVLGHGGKQHISMVSKRYIEKVEELNAMSEAALTTTNRHSGEDQRSGVERRSNVDRRTLPAQLEVTPISDPSEEKPDSESDEDR